MADPDDDVDDIAVKTPSPADQKIIDAAKRDFTIASESESENRKLALEDVKFKVGEQWPMNVRQARDIEQRPCLTINRMPQFIRQVTNDARHNRPSIKVSPCDSEGDEDIADVINGLFRHIEARSNADVAYDTAVENQVTMGWGYIRVMTEYVDDNTFDQEIAIKRVKNPLTVYYDPDCSEADYSDARFCLIVEDIAKSTFKEMYPDSATVSLCDFTSEGDAEHDWIKKDTIRIAEYWVRKANKKKIYQLWDGTITEHKPAKDLVVNEREIMGYEIKCYKISAADVLEEYDWKGKYIPIIPLIGDDTDVDGRRILSGLVRNAQDPQRMLNYWSTAITEAIALAPKAPFLIAEGQIEGYDQFWKAANVKSFPYLPYKPTTIEGQLIGPPQRQQAEPPIQAMMASVKMSNQQLMDTTGIYQSELGEDGQEVSGKAILARQTQSNITNFHYLDNLTRAIKYLATVVLDLIPHIYDAERTVRIIGEDGSESTIKINSQEPVKYNGVEKIFRMDVGRYDVVVNTGPSYSTKRQESAAQMLEFMRSFPESAPLIGDLMTKNLDWPGADAISERLKLMLPPQIQDAEMSGQPVPPVLRAKMGQMQHMIQSLQQELGKLQFEKQAKIVDNNSKERIAAIHSQTSLEEKLLEHHQQGNLASLQAELDTIAHSHQTQITQEFAPPPTQGASNG